MIGIRAKRPKEHVRPPDDVVVLFLTPDGRLPGFAQRRLNDLIAKKRTEGLTRKEQKELSEALDYIDAKTIPMLEHTLSARPAGRPRPGPRREGDVAGAKAPKAASRRNGRG